MTPALDVIHELQDFDAASAAVKIEAGIRNAVFHELRRKGAVLGLSGGVDSSVAAALAVRALGQDRVFGILMPECESSPDSLTLGKAVADWLGIESQIEDVGPILQAAGCYRRRDDAIRTLVPEYGDGYKCKLVTSDPASGSMLSISSLVVQGPDGIERKRRLTAEVHLAIVAATNFKQRVRKMMEYYYADRRIYAVLGTPNRLEYELGFFVKNGDGAADVKPLAHLYKTQVYALAHFLGVQAEICRKSPTTDTFPLQQSQQEFFFAVPYREMDLCLFAKNHGLPSEAAASVTGLEPELASAVYRMIDSKRRASRYLHQPPMLMEQVIEEGRDIWDC